MHLDVRSGRIVIVHRFLQVLKLKPESFLLSLCPQLLSTVVGFLHLSNSRIQALLQGFLQLSWPEKSNSKQVMTHPKPLCAHVKHTTRTNYKVRAGHAILGKFFHPSFRLCQLVRCFVDHGLQLLSRGPGLLFLVFRILVLFGFPTTQSRLLIVLVAILQELEGGP